MARYVQFTTTDYAPAEAPAPPHFLGYLDVLDASTWQLAAEELDDSELEHVSRQAHWTTALLIALTQQGQN